MWQAQCQKQAAENERLDRKMMQKSCKLRKSEGNL